MVYNIYYGYHSPVILNLLIRMLEIYTINNLCHIFVSTSNFLKASHLTNNIKVVFCFLLNVMTIHRNGQVATIYTLSPPNSMDRESDHIFRHKK